MSDKSKQRRANYQAKQEKKANHVVNWIFGVLVALGIIYMLFSIFMFS
ncbi:MAG: hypothetical protein ACOYJG_05335 [Prevotella sp.]|jgi:hypothetical protein